MRSLDERVRDIAQKRLTEIATGVAAALGGSAEVTYHRVIRSPPIIRMKRRMPSRRRAASPVRGRSIHQPIP